MTRLSRGRIAGFVLLAVALALIAAELIARRVFATPLFDADSRIGYVPKPNQSGSFLGKRWTFNALGMGTDRPFAPQPGEDILLVGDSIVFGGNPIDQADRLGTVLAHRTGATVWPISAPSWALQNELQYLRDHPQVVAGVDRIVFVLNPEDFGAPSSWADPASHPRVAERPALGLVARKIVGVDPAAPPPPSPMPVPQRDVLADWRAFARAAGKPISVAAFAFRVTGDRACGWAPPAFRAIGRWTCVSSSPRWSDALYRDDYHPSQAGIVALADIIAASPPALSQAAVRRGPPAAR